MCVVDTWAPEGSGPPRHIHYDADETFVLVSGQVELWCDGETSILNAGESAFVPRGTEHTFKVLSPEGARKFVILTPGGFEGLFADMAAGQFQIPADMPEVEASPPSAITWSSPARPCDAAGGGRYSAATLRDFSIGFR